MRKILEEKGIAPCSTGLLYDNPDDLIAVFRNEVMYRAIVFGIGNQGLEAPEDKPGEEYTSIDIDLDDDLRAYVEKETYKLIEEVVGEEAYAAIWNNELTNRLLKDAINKSSD